MNRFVAQAKIERLPPDVQARITLIEADVFGPEWPAGFDLVMLGGTCLYEIATPPRQAFCIERSVGAVIERDDIQQTHLVSKQGVETWLTTHGFVVAKLYGDRQGGAYTPDSPRAVFWAKKSAGQQDR